MLSAFHSEVLEFLKTSEVRSLPEIFDDYQHLFGGSTVHLEKLLLESLPQKDFVNLGLARYYPRMYRGLPRLYNRNQPAQSQIKRNFKDLAALKKQAVSRALFSLYAKVPPKGKITLFTWVMNDGLGDFFATYHVMRMLKNRFPELDVQFVALVPAEMKLSIEGVCAIPYEGDCSTLPEEAMALLRNADLILQMPTFYPHTAELMKAVGSVKMELIGEYGYGESSWFHPKSGAYSMGLHFLEKGILIRKPRQATWDDVQNEYLKQWRNSDHHFYLAYLSTPIGGAIYLHALLKSLENDSQGIDLCVPDLGWFIQYIEKQNKAKRAALEWDLGIESMEVCFDDTIHTIPVSPKGKRLRILCPGQISPTDFQALLTLSGDFVAVRGNQSLTEALSLGKPFFYDGRDHARYLMKDLIALAENRIGDHPSALACIRGMNQSFLYNLPIQEEQWVDETFFQELTDWTSIALGIGLALQDPEVALGFKKLSQIVSAEFSANSFICHLVQRALCHHHHPEIKKVEEEQLALFLSGARTFSELVQNLSQVLI